MATTKLPANKKRKPAAPKTTRAAPKTARAAPARNNAPSPPKSVLVPLPAIRAKNDGQKSFWGELGETLSRWLKGGASTNKEAGEAVDDAKHVEERCKIIEGQINIEADREGRATELIVDRDNKITELERRLERQVDPDVMNEMRRQVLTWKREQDLALRELKEARQKRTQLLEEGKVHCSVVLKQWRGAKDWSTIHRSARELRQNVDNTHSRHDSYRKKRYPALVTRIRGVIRAWNAVAGAAPPRYAGEVRAMAVESESTFLGKPPV